MKKIWILLASMIMIGLIAICFNVEVKTNKKSPLMLRNIEALAGDESGSSSFPCTVAGGFCYYQGIPYFGISLI